MEVHGFDMLAQVEAMTRHGREYQGEMQRLRGILGKGRQLPLNGLPYEAVRRGASPGLEIAAFVEGTYVQAATLAGGDRPTLERPVPAVPR
jgi:hypothetical protein